MLFKLVRKILVRLVILALLVAAALAGYKWVSAQVEYKKGEGAYKLLEKFLHLEDYEPGKEKAKAPHVDTLLLKGINPDYVGWIYIPDTNVNYPIVRGEDNTTYLTKMFSGGDNAAGTIFMDCDNSRKWTDYHTVIYGNNTENSTMFAQVENYKSQGWYDDHPTGLLLTEDGNFELQFFAGYYASFKSSAWDTEIEDAEDYAAWLQQVQESSVIKSDIVPDTENRVVTLSVGDTGFVLLAVLKPI